MKHDPYDFFNYSYQTVIWFIYVSNINRSCWCLIGVGIEN